VRIRCRLSAPAPDAFTRIRMTAASTCWATVLAAAGPGGPETRATQEAGGDYRRLAAQHPRRLPPTVTLAMTPLHNLGGGGHFAKSWRSRRKPWRPMRKPCASCCRSSGSCPRRSRIACDVCCATIWPPCGRGGGSGSNAPAGGRRCWQGLAEALGRLLTGERDPQALRRGLALDAIDEQALALAEGAVADEEMRALLGRLASEAGGAE
jgi:hypothetical protein